MQLFLLSQVTKKFTLRICELKLFYVIIFVSTIIDTGAEWNPKWRNDKGSTMMHLLLASYPPPRSQMHEYMKLVSSAVASGLSLVAEDDYGNTPIFVLCERFSMVSVDSYPDAIPLMKSLIHVARLTAQNPVANSSSITPNTFELANRQGKTVFDLPDYVPSSCLSVCKPYLAELAIPSQVELRNSIHDAEDEYENIAFIEKQLNSSSCILANTPTSDAFNKSSKLVSGLQGQNSLHKINKTKMTSAQLLSSFYNVSSTASNQQPHQSTAVTDRTLSHNKSSQKRLNFNKLDNNRTI